MRVGARSETELVCGHVRERAPIERFRVQRRREPVVIVAVAGGAGARLDLTGLTPSPIKSPESLGSLRRQG